MVKVTKIVLVVLAVIAIAAAAPAATATETVIDEQPPCVWFSVNPPGVAVDPGCLEGGVPPPSAP